MIFFSDLHTHSCASDGQYAPGELIKLAKDRGIEVLALTDHDTTDGIEAAVAAGAEIGVRVLRGVELAAKEHRHLHILGLCYAEGESDLTRLCNKLRQGRDERKYRIISFLHEKGIDISLNEVEELAGGAVIARPHFAQIMVRHGFVRDNREAFDKYLDTDEYQRIERFKVDARTCIETIHNSGGKASLAHPYQLNYDNEKLEELVCELKDYGLDALECYYPKHSPEQQKFYLSLAEKYNLHVTGGSDFHGERVKPDVDLAAVPLELKWLLG